VKKGLSTFYSTLALLLRYRLSLGNLSNS